MGAFSSHRQPNRYQDFNVFSPDCEEFVNHRDSLVDAIISSVFTLALDDPVVFHATVAMGQAFCEATQSQDVLAPPTN
jgi:hypothetical protein